MEKWNFISEKSTAEINNKFHSNFDSLKGFVLKTSIENDEQITFKIRKRVKYGWYIAYHNWTVVKGKLIKSKDNSNTKIKIVFAQHFLIKLILYAHIVLGAFVIISIVSEVSNNQSKIIFGGILLLIGILLWIIIQKKFKQDIKKYKNLIYKIAKE
ncbi:hypothetical protein [Polaribacter porphyrae]|uniref:DUF423 domain-containing protein n=1 Tax=Polaribacter porphyrae TaxID=1137780 RepID=A0A2S7WRA0_9FLAO|nr:hypothetical protein [Polaribacter porphyrae]PQJ80114.1 hypothetical protein BTO18_13430 [Polaribacter porphyrae]